MILKFSEAFLLNWAVKIPTQKERSAEDWQRWLYDVTKQASAEQGHELPTYDEFRDNGWFKLEPPEGVCDAC